AREADCLLAPYWAAELGRDGELVGEQASPRGGFVRATPRGDRVALRGRAVTVLEGDLRV
ncbi:MAG: oxidoreductase, partial [Saccharopolyspora sp.]|nr:oxidoreductase [Saccharopolyspora sp.]